MLNLSLAAQGVLSHLLGVGLEALELSRRNMFQEHFVDFFKGASGRLWLVKIKVDPAQHREAAKYK